MQVHAHEYHAELAKSTWLGMMAARFWSTFSHCTQQELDQVRAVECIRPSHAHPADNVTHT